MSNPWVGKKQRAAGFLCFLVKSRESRLLSCFPIWKAKPAEQSWGKAEKVCFLKVGELWPLPIVAAYESAPSKFTSQPNPTNQTHAPKYRLSESEFTNTYVINIIYINIAVKSLKI